MARSKVNYAKLYEEAKAAADKAIAGLPEPVFPCGFAYVYIRPARGSFVTWLKKNKIGRSDSYYGGYCLNSWHFCSHQGQNMDVKAKAATVFVNYLTEHGVPGLSMRTQID